MLIRISLVIRDTELHRRIRRQLRRANDVLVAQTAGDQDLWAALEAGPYDLLVVDETSLPEPAAAQITEIRRLPDRPEVVVLQSGDDAEARAGLLAAGALAVVSTELGDDSLARTLEALVQRRREAVARKLELEKPRLESRLSDFSALSEPMQRLLSVAHRVVPSSSSLLILGETGVGKEWLARAIHAEGPRGRAPFVAINCSAIPDSLLESELFGHEKGAFTDASRSRRGYFELAHRGTVFLDEIADMSPHLQAKLLRVIQERRLQRVGAEQPIDVDVRLMAATHRDLDRAMLEGTFRSDLFYRLSVVTLTVPPLRERRADIPALAEGYLYRFAEQFQSPVQSFDTEALEALAAYSWPGNVRELINVIERSVLLCSSAVVSLADLPEAIVRSWRSRVDRPVSDPPAADLDQGWLERPLKDLRRELVERVERRYLAAQLQRCDGRVGEVANRSGLTPRGLHDKMKRLGLRKEDFR